MTEISNASSNFRDVMLDIETLGKTANAPLLSYSLAPFNIATGEVGTMTSLYFDLDENAEYGRLVETDTLRWWVQDHPEILADLLSRDATPLSDGLLQLNGVLFTINPDRLWVRGVTFDLPILENLRECLGLEEMVDMWWQRGTNFRRVHEVRTALWMTGVEASHSGSMAHTSDNDVRSQIVDVCCAYRRIH